MFNIQHWRRQGHPTPVLLPGKSHGRRSLVACSPWGHKESDTTERLHFHFSLSCIGEGNGHPLQCSCLENPRDGGAWWAAVYGVAQSRTRLKRLSSSSSNIQHVLSIFFFQGNIIKKLNIYHPKGSLSLKMSQWFAQLFCILNPNSHDCCMSHSVMETEKRSHAYTSLPRFCVAAESHFNGFFWCLHDVFWGQHRHENIWRRGWGRLCIPWRRFILGDLVTQYC